MLNSNFSFNFSFDKIVQYPKNLDELKKLTCKTYTIVGNLRSYNDSAIGRNPISIKEFNKVLNFDIKKKEIEVEAGIILKDFFKIVLEENLILKSLPGTKYVTIGGMIAQNIQGKNLKFNFIKDHILSIKILHNSEIYYCSNEYNSELFNYTIGGKGSTGVIISAKFKLENIDSKNIIVKKIFFNNILEMKNQFLSAKNNYEYIVCWVDFLSRRNNGILFCANHKSSNKFKKEPKEHKLPNFLLNILNYFSHTRIFTFLFNAFFKIKNKLKKTDLINIHNFFFVQDSIINWNYIYKNKGFFQFQFECELDKLELYLDKISYYMGKKFFSNFVIIKFINKPSGLFCTISMDIPLNNNFIFIKKILNKLYEDQELLISLSKDSIIEQVNQVTKNNNRFLKNKNFLEKNFQSDFLNRIKY